MTKTYDGNRVLEDGETLTVRMTLMDHAPSPAARHSPGSTPLADAERDAREALIDERNERLSNAWRAPDSEAVQISHCRDVDESYAERERRLTTAWKGTA